MINFIKKPIVIIFIIVILGLGAGGYFYFGREEKSEFDVAIAKRSNLIQEVSVTGRVKPAESEEIVPRVVKSIELTLRESHNIDNPKKDDFHITTQADAAERVQTITGILTALGGIIGIILGASLSFLASLVLSRVVAQGWAFAFPVSAAILGISVSTLVGLAFGLYPARQASIKSPIEALRYE